jgi:hypothetical protein
VGTQTLFSVRKSQIFGLFRYKFANFLAVPVRKL